MKYTIPAKTFLIGEYSALVGGSVLGLATGPGFEVKYSKAMEATPPFHTNSPAGLLWNQEITDENSADELKNIKIEIVELFNNLGGFGRSTAEYLSALIPSLIKKNEDFVQIRKKYQELSLKSGAGASGADLAIQYFGNVTIVNGSKNSYSSTGWKLTDHDFILVSTGQKVKTHEHVSQLDLKLIQTFPKFSDAIVDTYLTGSAEDFIAGVSDWSNFLAGHGLTHSYSSELKKAILKIENVLCAKPCGALGADVIAIICKKECSQSIQNELASLKLIIQGTSADLMPGVHSQLANHANQQISKDFYVG
ncbi:MAG: hypothetical protein H7256_04510 [Bdellovibrio sp.]|nr:hypothetical protein [Bdellovibrio sp.]